MVTCFVARVVGVWWRENCVCHRTAFCAVLLNVLCLPSNFQAVKWHLNVTEVLVPDLMSTDAFVLVWRPVYRSNLTHVATLISFFFWKGLFLVTVFVASKPACLHSVVKGLVLVTVFVASKLACLYSVVKRELSERMWHFAAPVCDGRNSLIWRIKKLRFLLGDDTLLPISFTSCFPVFIY